MKFIDSGEGKVPLLSALAILAISLTVNLPGLAISPVLGKLKEFFHSIECIVIMIIEEERRHGLDITAGSGAHHRSLWLSLGVVEIIGVEAVGAGCVV